MDEMKLNREFTISTRYFNGAKEKDELYVNGNYIFENGNDFLIYKGELFHSTDILHNILCNIRKEGFLSLKKLRGEFVIAYYDGLEKEIKIITDKLGLEPLYYYVKIGDEPNLIISTDFWKVLDLCEPMVEDLDVQAIKEFILFYKPLFWKTIVKDVHSFPAATSGTFNVKNFQYNIIPYWDFRFRGDENITLDRARENLDDAINTVVKEIVKLNGVSKVYGVGISGGQDTRIIPSYLMRNGVEQIKGFIIGKSRPHRILLSRDHKNARNIAEYYGIEQIECDYSLDSFEDKIAIDVRYNPMRSSNFLKALTTSVPKFDILITGSYGTIVGGHLIFEGMDSLTTEELTYTIAATLSRINPRKKDADNPLKKFLKIMKNLVFGTKSKSRKIIERKAIKGIITETEFEVALKSINEYVKREKSKGKNNYDIFMKYHLLISNKYGAFESLSGTRKAYSIYFPSSLEEISNWPPNFVIGRKVLEHLIYTNLRELAKIPGQSSGIPIFYQYEDVSKYMVHYHKIKSLFSYFIRGNGLRYDDWIRTKEFKKFSLNMLQKNNDFFNKIFDVGEIIENVDDLNELVFENVIKVKYMIDLILSKQYKLWFTENKY